MFHLVTGGSGSGKSEYAEKLIEGWEIQDIKRRKYYIATMMPFGEETQEKIARHRQMRAGKGFQTVECYTDLQKAAREFPENKNALTLLECMSNLTANELYHKEGAGLRTTEAVMEGIRMLRDRSSLLVVVTNEVFSESAEDTEEMRRYKKTLGEINRQMAEMADRVTEVVYGIPLEVKNR